MFSHIQGHNSYSTLPFFIQHFDVQNSQIRHFFVLNDLIFSQIYSFTFATYVNLHSTTIFFSTLLWYLKFCAPPSLRIIGSHAPASGNTCFWRHKDTKQRLCSFDGRHQPIHPRDTRKRFIRGSSAPRFNSIPLYTILDRKGILFEYLLLKNDTPFVYLVSSWQFSTWPEFNFTQAQYQWTLKKNSNSKQWKFYKK